MPDIIQIMPADGWKAVFIEDEETGDLWVEPIAGWSLIQGEADSDSDPDPDDIQGEIIPYVFDTIGTISFLTYPGAENLHNYLGLLNPLDALNDALMISFYKGFMARAELTDEMSLIIQEKIKELSVVV